MKDLPVGNLPNSTTKVQLRNAFGMCGQVDSVNMITDRDTGRARGFAFLAMGDSGGAEKAIPALNGSDFRFGWPHDSGQRGQNFVVKVTARTDV